MFYDRVSSSVKVELECYIFSKKVQCTVIRLVVCYACYYHKTARCYEAPNCTVFARDLQDRHHIYGISSCGPSQLGGVYTIPYEYVTDLKFRLN